MIVNSTPSLEGASFTLGYVQGLLSKEMETNLENTGEMVNLLNVRMYLDMIHEWVQNSEEMESKNALDVLNEIQDGWKYYGDG